MTWGAHAVGGPYFPGSEQNQTYRITEADHARAMTAKTKKLTPGEFASLLLSVTRP
jgi:hypothetical protein